ncbi:metacaspase-2-like isoform X1 [Galleria mellonella]|uniref:Metacaspase-2-like isoform X1 n=1 Tax=Galleria mellonella TaxID=7137 RepID=A0ABM3MVE6_GALME|nr:metacaspase-2-like isoform X1 [Galleria mellonella]
MDIKKFERVIKINSNTEILNASDCSCTNCDTLRCFTNITKRNQNINECTCGKYNNSKTTLVYSNQKVNINNSMSDVSIEIKDDDDDTKVTNDGGEPKVLIDIISSMIKGDEKLKVSINKKERFKKEIIYEYNNNKNDIHITKKKSKYIYKITKSKDKINNVNDINDKPSAQICTGTPTYSRKEISPNTAQLSAQIINKPFKDLKKSVSNYQSEKVIKKMSKYDIFKRIKEVYKACSCKVCKCIVGKSFQNSNEQCKCAPCECNDCINFIKILTDKENIKKQSPIVCPCIRCERSQCKGIINSNVIQSCDCKPCDCIQCIDNLSKFCDCEPCQCLECKTMPKKKIRTIVVAPVGEDNQGNKSQFSPCDYTERSHGFPLSTNLMHEMSTGMSRHNNCRCENCLQQTCGMDDNDNCICDRSNKVIRKQVQQDFHDYDIRYVSVNNNTRIPSYWNNPSKNNIKNAMSSNFRGFNITRDVSSYFNEDASSTPEDFFKRKFVLPSFISSCSNSGYDNAIYHPIKLPKNTVETCINDVFKFNSNKNINYNRINMTSRSINNSQTLSDYGTITNNIVDLKQYENNNVCQYNTGFTRLNTRDMKNFIDYKRVYNSLREAKVFSLELNKILEKYERANRDFQSISQRLKSIHDYNINDHIVKSNKKDCYQQVTSEMAQKEIDTYEQTINNDERSCVISIGNEKKDNSFDFTNDIHLKSKIIPNATNDSFNSIPKNTIMISNSFEVNEYNDDIEDKQMLINFIDNNNLYNAPNCFKTKEEIFKSQTVNVDHKTQTISNNNENTYKFMTQSVVTKQNSFATSSSSNSYIQAVGVKSSTTTEQNSFFKDCSITSNKIDINIDNQTKCEIPKRKQKLHDISKEALPALANEITINLKNTARKEIEFAVNNVKKTMVKDENMPASTQTERHNITVRVKKEINCSSTEIKRECKQKSLNQQFLLKSGKSSTARQCNHVIEESRSNYDALKASFLRVRRVSDHTVLVKWNVPQVIKDVQGYELLVDGRAVQKIFSPVHSMAVVTCLPHSNKVLLTIRTITTSASELPASSIGAVWFKSRQKI